MKCAAQKALEALISLAKESPLAVRAYKSVAGFHPTSHQKFQPEDMALLHALSNPESLIDVCRKAHAGDETYNNATQRDYGRSMLSFVVKLSRAYHDALLAGTSQCTSFTEEQRQVCRDIIQMVWQVGNALSSIPLPKKPRATRAPRASRSRKAVAA